MGIPCLKEKNVVKRLESLKKIIVLWLSFAGLLLQTGIYAYIWMEYYYPIISKFTLRLKFNQNGHLAMFAIYFVLLFFFDSTYGGLKIGYLKPMDVFMSQLFALLFVNVITYLQISLMNGWWLEPKYFLAATLVQLLTALVWNLICNCFTAGCSHRGRCCLFMENGRSRISCRSLRPERTNIILQNVLISGKA